MSQNDSLQISKDLKVFTEIKNRDAWSTLRGFVYQVDMTILRWLDLGDNDLLELEKGEDIDIITRDIERHEVSRELEQVKYRETNITLNQDVSIEMLLNFFLHRNNNPQHKVYFKFVTNTNYGIERPALFLDGKGGIDVWIELSKSDKINNNDERYIAIKRHLLKRINERIIDESKLVGEKEVIKNKEWKLFYAHFENDDNLIQIISDFEWSYGNGDHIEITEVIKRKLVDSEIEAELSNVDIVYSRLFLFVFKLLCNKSSKTLDKTELKRQTSLPKLNASDERTIEFINNLLLNLNHKINELDKKVNINTTQISTLISDVNLINNSDTVFDFRLRNISTKPPSLIKNGTQRKDKVAEIKNIFTKYSWIHFQGINGTGKSQLAALVCYQYKNFWWLDLRPYNQNIEKTSLLIEAFLSTISNCPIINERDIWVKIVLESFPENTLIVLNDLPRVEKDSGLSELLNLLCNHAINTNFKLLTTSNFKISANIMQSLSENILNEYYDFNFTDEEIIEFLVNNGANESIAKYINLITAISQRNPQLVSAIIHHLKIINWGQDSNDLFEVFFKNEFSAEILEDAQLSIKKFIPDVNSRELLYRLSLIHWNFKHKEICTISEVEEKIYHPNEKLQDLLYIWVQDQEDSFQVSPLIHDIGVNNLSQDVIQNIHIAIARSILSNKKLDQISASRSISSFIKGKDYNNAGIVLLNLLQSAKLEEEINILSRWGYLNYWSELDIPKQMSVTLRASIRKEQIRLHQTTGKDVTNFETRLEEYTKEDSITKSERLLVHFIILSNFNVSNLSNYWGHLDYVLKNWKQIDTPFKAVLNAEMFSGILWSIIQKLITENDINTWLNNIKVFELDFKINFFDNEIAQTAINIISSNVVNSEYQKEEKDWKLVASTLGILIKYFKNRKLELLEVVVLKEVIALEFNIKKNHQKAEESTNTALSKVLSNDTKYLLYENIGKLYFNDKQNEKAKVWLLKALEIDCISQTNYIDTLIFGAASVSSEDSNKAVSFCEKSIELAKSKEDYLELDFIRILGELAIAYWVDEDYKRSFETFEDVVNRLLKIKVDTLSQYWIRLISWCSHSLGYISASVARDHVPQYVSSGREYTKPYQGIFSFNTKALSDLYKSKNDPVILAHLAIFSDGINNISQAYHWALRAFDLARINGDQKIFMMISGICSQYSLINFKIEEAFESFLLYSVVSYHLKGSTPEEKHDSIDNIKLPEILSNKPSEKWDTAEESTISFVIIPLFIMVLTSYLENSEYKNGYKESFKKMLSDYIPKASNRTLWELVLELSNRILENQISERELTDRGNTFGQQNRKYLQIICYLGLIYSTNKREAQLSLIVNIFPYLTAVNKPFKSVIKFVLIPFVENICLSILRDSYVGTNEEYKKLVDSIKNLDIRKNNAIQLIIQPIVKELDMKVVESGKSWLYEYKEI